VVTRRRCLSRKPCWLTETRGGAGDGDGSHLSQVLVISHSLNNMDRFLDVLSLGITFPYKKMCPSFLWDWNKSDSESILQGSFFHNTPSYREFIVYSYLHLYSFCSIRINLCKWMTEKNVERFLVRVAVAVVSHCLESIIHHLLWPSRV
jgi:hypothetical protein